MTRINCGIPPAYLHDKHLLAEHREIKRIPNAVKNGKASFKNSIPEKFTLGKGHVRFFYNKLLYLNKRYHEIYEECIKRGFKVEYYGKAWAFKIPEELYQDYMPTIYDTQLVENRINERLKTMK